MVETQLYQKPRNSGLQAAVISGLIILAAGGLSSYVWELHREGERIKESLSSLKVLIASVQATQTRAVSAMQTEHEVLHLAFDDLSLRASRVARRQETMQNMIQDNRLIMAKLPHSLSYPFSEKWQTRIVENEKNIAILKSIFGEVYSSAESPKKEKNSRPERAGSTN